MTETSSRRPGSVLDGPPRAKPRPTRARGAARVSKAQAQAVDLGRLLRAVAHPVRLRIIDSLAQRDFNVTALCRRLDQPQAIVSQQLRILRLSGIVEPHRDRGFVRYRLASRPVRTLVQHIGRWAVPPA